MIVLPSNAMFHDTEPGELKNFAVSRRVAIIVMGVECQAPAAATRHLVLDLEVKGQEKNVIISPTKNKLVSYNLV